MADDDLIEKLKRMRIEAGLESDIPSRSLILPQNRYSKQNAPSPILEPNLEDRMDNNFELYDHDKPYFDEESAYKAPKNKPLKPKASPIKQAGKKQGFWAGRKDRRARKKEYLKTKSKTYRIARFTAKWSGILTLLAAITGVSGVKAGQCYIENELSKQPKLSYERLKNRAPSETRFFDSEGTQIGAAFGDRHRKYVEYKDIPKTLVDIVVAAEDEYFFSHNGYRLRSIAVAGCNEVLRKTIRRGRKKRGGSTLTQQTAKLYLFPPNTPRSIPIKIKELVQARRLERDLTKQQILELYLNNYYVNSTGYGISIAAKYFFDIDDIADLKLKRNPRSDTLGKEDIDRLLKNTFIAISLKGGSYYDIFMSNTSKRAKRIKGRMQYGLDRALFTGKISKQSYRDALARLRKLDFRKKDSFFRKGRFQFDQKSYLAVAIDEMIKRPEIRKALNEKGILTPHMAPSQARAIIKHAGLSVYTYLRGPWQRAAERIIAENASSITTLLDGYQTFTPNKKAFGIEKLEKDKIYQCKVTGFDLQGRKGKRSKVTIAIGSKKYTLSYAGFEDALRNDIRNRRRRTRSSRVRIRKSTVRNFLRRIENQTTLCSVVDAGDSPILKLIQKPNVQGTMIVVKDGKYQVYVGSTDNTDLDYNLKGIPPGSINKVLFLMAAYSRPELKINLDQLIRSSIAPIQYYSHGSTADGRYRIVSDLHKSKSIISLRRAIISSDNVAMTKFYETMLDNASINTLTKLARRYHLLKKQDETPKDYFKRLMNDVQVFSGSKDKRLDMEMRIYDTARRNLLRAGALSDEERNALLLLDYGLGYEELARRQRRTSKRNLLLFNYLSAKAKYDEAKRRLTNQQDPNAITTNPADPNNPTSLTIPPEERIPENVDMDLEIDGKMIKIPGSLMKKIGDEVNKVKPTMEEWYSDASMINHPKVRTYIVSKIIEEFLKKYGIEMKVSPAEILGPNPIPGAKLVQAYESFRTGKACTPSIIDRITDKEGNTIWDGDPKCTDIMEGLTTEQKEKIEYDITQLLHHIATDGTAARSNGVHYYRRGRPYIRGKVSERFDDKKVLYAAFGKTGTVAEINRAGYKTGRTTAANFMGYVMCLPDEKRDIKELELGELCTVLTQFSDYKKHGKGKPNQGMGHRLSATDGALPAYIELYRYIIEDQDYSNRVKWKDIMKAGARNIGIGFPSAWKTVYYDSNTFMPIAEGSCIYKIPETKNRPEQYYCEGENGLINVTKVRIFDVPMPTPTLNPAPTQPATPMQPGMATPTVDASKQD